MAWSVANQVDFGRLSTSVVQTVLGAAVSIETEVLTLAPSIAAAKDRLEAPPTDAQGPGPRLYTHNVACDLLSTVTRLLGRSVGKILVSGVPELPHLLMVSTSYLSFSGDMIAW